MLGTNYMVMAYRNSPAWYDTNVVIGGTEFGVVASQDETHVTITPAAATGTRPAGESYDILLQRGETYRSINEDGADADFTGTTIVSDKPVAVLAGHRAALVPASCAAADHLVEQMPPTEMWGRQFVTMPLATRAGGDTFRFLAQTNGTRVTINGRLAATLGRGQFHEAVIEGPARILCSQPILAAQFANGSDYDGTTGDPFMTLIPPVEQFGGDYTLSTAPPVWNLWNRDYENLYTNYLNVVVRSNGVGQIRIDDANVPADAFQAIGDTGYAGFQLRWVPARIISRLPFRSAPAYTAGRGTRPMPSWAVFTPRPSMPGRHFDWNNRRPSRQPGAKNAWPRMSATRAGSRSVISGSISLSPARTRLLAACPPRVLAKRPSLTPGRTAVWMSSRQPLWI